MSYELSEVSKIARVFHDVETEAEKFLSISGFALKNKEHKIKSAQSTLKAIEEYRRLPLEVRKELESDKRNHVASIVQLELACNEALK